jgi:hypothetical protein
MDQITHDVRTAQWAEIVRKCHERPENQSAKNWLNENGINEKQYYYWQRRLRNLAAGTTNKSLPTTRSSGEVTFIEMPSPNELPGERMEEVTINSEPAALIRVGGLEIELHNGISDELLGKILKVTAYAR